MAQKLLDFCVIWSCLASLQQSELLSGRETLSQARLLREFGLTKEVMLHA